MARKRCRPAATLQRFLAPAHTRCWACDGPLWVIYHTARTVAMLEGLCRFILTVRRCENRACPLYHWPYRPEEETAVALPPWAQRALPGATGVGRCCGRRSSGPPPSKPSSLTRTAPMLCRIQVSGRDMVSC